MLYWCVRSQAGPQGSMSFSSGVLPGFQRLLWETKAGLQLSPLRARGLCYRQCGKAGHRSDSLICHREVGGPQRRWNIAPKCCFGPSRQSHGSKPERIKGKKSKGRDRNEGDLRETRAVLAQVSTPSEHEVALHLLARVIVKKHTVLLNTFFFSSAKQFCTKYFIHSAPFLISKPKHPFHVFLTITDLVQY